MRRLALAALAVLVAAAAAWLALGRPGTGSGAGPSPSPSIPAVAPSSQIVADGRAVPARWAALEAAVPGTIAAVLVTEGDAVAAGAPLVRLDDAVARADLDAAAAAVAAARADASRAAAGTKQAAAAVDAAEAAEAQAVAVLDRARAARDALPAGSSSASRRVADADVDAASAALAGARASLRGARAAATGAAEAAKGADAGVSRAEAGRSAAEAAVARLTINAPFAGTVASLDARTGEQAAPGVALVRLADPAAGWRIETTDLDETTVARVPVGAAVTVTFDGLPGVTLEGRVVSVALYGTTSQGDIVYRAVVEPATVPAGLRWNMTAAVTVKAGE